MFGGWACHKDRSITFWWRSNQDPEPGFLNPDQDTHPENFYCSARLISLSVDDIYSSFTFLTWETGSKSQSSCSSYCCYQFSKNPKAFLCRDYNCDSTTIRLRYDYDPTTTYRAPASNSTQAKNEHVIFSS